MAEDRCTQGVAAWRRGFWPGVLTMVGGVAVHRRVVVLEVPHGRLVFDRVFQHGHVLVFVLRRGVVSLLSQNVRQGPRERYIYVQDQRQSKRRWLSLEEKNVYLVIHSRCAISSTHRRGRRHPTERQRFCRVTRGH